MKRYWKIRTGRFAVYIDNPFVSRDTGGDWPGAAKLRPKPIFRIMWAHDHGTYVYGLTWVPGRRLGTYGPRKH